MAALVLLAGFVALLLILNGYRLTVGSWESRQNLLWRMRQLGLPSPPSGLWHTISTWFARSRLGLAMAHRLERADVRIAPATFVLILLSATALVFLVIRIAILLSYLLNLILAALVVLGATALFLQFREGAYLAALSQQMPEVAMLVSNSLRAGLSVAQAIDVVAEKMPRPAGPEFRRLSHELGLGSSLDETVNRMLQRLPSPELRLVLTTIVIQRRAGGDLARALTVMSNAVRARHQLRQEIQTMTAEARFSIGALAIMPLLVLIILNRVMPGSVERFFSQPVGLVVGGLFLVALFAVFFLARKVMQVEL